MIEMASGTQINSQQGKITESEARAFLSRVQQSFSAKPFKPHRAFTGGHAQTLAAYAWPRRAGLRFDDKARLFQVEPGVQVLSHCRWQSDPTKHPTLVVWHGMEGSSSSIYMLGTAHKAFQAGFNVVRVNLRNCGGTEQLSPTFYHGGLTGDLRAVVSELIETDRLPRLYLAGFSLGGNLVLKLAAEYGEEPPTEVQGVCAISPAIDLDASTQAINQPSNWIYQQSFVRNMRKRVRVMNQIYPERYDLSRLHLVRTVIDFDEHFTAVSHGFAGAADYYQKSSAVRLLDRIRITTLIIHAEDDPFIPFAPLRDPAIAANPYILLVATTQGGHVAFIAAKTDHEDRFWSENRLVEFCRLAETEYSATPEVDRHQG